MWLVECINFSPGALPMGIVGRNVGVSMKMKIHSAGWFYMFNLLAR